MHGRQPSKKCFIYNNIDQINGENVQEIYSKMQDVQLYFIERFENDYIV